MKVDNIIIAKLSCDDSILKASKKFGANDIKEVVSAALIFTPFVVEHVELLQARVAEKYFSACKRLGYETGFFREYTILALCRLEVNSNFGFDGIYVPFSGELYLIPRRSLSVEPASAGKCELVLSRLAHKTWIRRFSIGLEDSDESSSAWRKLKDKLIGKDFSDFDGKRISSLAAQEDVEVENRLGQDNTKEFPPMYFLYNEV